MFLPHSFFIFVLILLANSKDFLGVILNISERFSLDFMIIFYLPGYQEAPATI
ncbi:hypothetical protein CLOSCI_00372 [[Clostridium] scindens ATCC 35704]|nr:hypothetical protein CLOSCI_00372 [[Clostridium] scindens ATCC 35704]